MFALTCAISLFAYFVNLRAREFLSITNSVVLATENEWRLKEDASVGCVFRPHTVSNLTLRVQPIDLLNLTVTYHTTSFNIQKFYVLLALCLCVVYGSQNKLRLLAYTTLIDWFCITEVERVY